MIDPIKVSPYHTTISGLVVADHSKGLPPNLYLYRRVIQHTEILNEMVIGAYTLG